MSPDHRLKCPLSIATVCASTPPSLVLVGRAQRCRSKRLDDIAGESLVVGEVEGGGVGIGSEATGDVEGVREGGTHWEFVNLERVGSG